MALDTLGYDPNMLTPVGENGWMYVGTDAMYTTTNIEDMISARTWDTLTEILSGFEDLGTNTYTHIYTLTPMFL